MTKKHNQNHGNSDEPKVGLKDYPDPPTDPKTDSIGDEPQAGLQDYPDPPTDPKTDAP